MRAAGESGFGVGNLEFQAINSQGPGPMSMVLDPDTREGWNALRVPDTYRNTAIGESSQMQNLQRTKRQNCGNMMQGHHTPIGGSSSNAQNIENEGSQSHCPGQTFASFRGSVDYANRRLNFQTGCLETGNGSSSCLALNEGHSRENHWNTNLSVSDIENSQFQSNGSFTNPHPHTHLGNGSRIPCKRKSSMDNISGSQPFRSSGSRDTEAARFTEGSGLSRADISSIRFPDSAATSMTTVWDEPQYCRGSDAMHTSERVNSLHYPQTGNSNRYRGRSTFVPPDIRQPSAITTHRRISSATYPAQTWIARGIPGSESIPEQEISLSEPLPLNQTNSSSGIVIGSSNFTAENMNSGFVSGTPRDSHSTTYVGSTTRNRTNGAPPYWMGVPPDGLVQTPYEPNRVMPSMPSRPVTLRDTGPHGTHILPNPYIYPGSASSRTSAYNVPSNRRNSFHSPNGLMPFPPPCAAVNNLIPRSQPSFGDSYPSFPAIHGTAVTSFFPGSLEGGRVSPVQNNYRVPVRTVQVMPAVDGGNRRHFSSHDLLDQSQVYNGVDIHDQHSNMRLDVDNMSYEELLQLEERIGNVCTGLSEEAVKKCLKITKYSSIAMTSTFTSQDSEVKCSICQEEYIDGEEMGKLGCGHTYHTACIKQWLVLKNLCPICKSTAYSSC